MELVYLQRSSQPQGFTECWCFLLGLCCGFRYNKNSEYNKNCECSDLCWVSLALLEILRISGQNDALKLFPRQPLASGWPSKQMQNCSVPSVLPSLSHGVELISRQQVCDALNPSWNFCMELPKLGTVCPCYSACTMKRKTKAISIYAKYAKKNPRSSPSVFCPEAD